MIINPTISANGRYTDIFSLNMESRNIFLTGEITDELATSIISQLLYLSRDSYRYNDADIYLYINSPGGSVSAGLAIYDTMQHIKPEVRTICTGTAASMAAILLSGGAKGKRYLLPHSEVMVHQPSCGTEGQASDILITAEHITKLRCELNKILSGNCGKDLRDVEAATERDTWLDAEEAVQFGIADQILKSSGN